MGAGGTVMVPSAARGGQRGFGAAGQPPAGGQRKADSPVSAWPMTRVCISDGALVGEHRLEVVRVAHHRVLAADAVGPQDRAGGAADLDRLGDVVVTCRPTHLLGAQSHGVLAAAEVEREQAPPSCSSVAMFASLAWVRLEAGDRAPELDALHRVPAGRVERGPRGPERPPDDAVARLAEARERALEATDLGQHGIRGQAQVLEGQLRGHGRAQGHLVGDLVRGEARGVRGDHEAADAAVLLARVGPDDGDVGDRAVGDPRLRAVGAPQLSPSRRARVRMEAGSEPWSGSVRPKQPMTSPAAIRAATPACAPPTRSARSRTSRGCPAPRPASGCRSRSPRARGTQARSRRPTCRRSRTPRGACRAGPPCRTHGPAPARRGGRRPRTTRRRTGRRRRRTPAGSPRGWPSPRRSAGCRRRRGRGGRTVASASTRWRSCPPS